MTRRIHTTLANAQTVGQPQETHLLTGENCDALYSWNSFNRIQNSPETPIANGKQITYTCGDLHGNPIRLLAFLARIHYIAPLTEDQFNTFIHLFRIAPTLNTSRGTSTFQEFSLAFNHHLIENTSITLNSRLILIGDVLCDRGPSDIMMLELLRWMGEQHINFTVIFSNHDLEFLKAYAQGFPRALAQVIQGHFPNGQHDSILPLLLAETLVKQRMQFIVKNFYLPRLKLIDYDYTPSSTNNSTLFVYTHTRLDLQLIERLAGMRFRTTISSNPLVKIKNNITAINDAFEAEFSNTVNFFLTITDGTPYHNFVWARDFTRLTPYPPGLFSVFGHVGPDPTSTALPDSMINLDNSNLGKRYKEPQRRRICEFDSGPLIVLRVFTHSTSYSRTGASSPTALNSRTTTPLPGTAALSQQTTAPTSQLVRQLPIADDDDEDDDDTHSAVVSRFMTRLRQTLSVNTMLPVGVAPVTTTSAAAVNLQPPPRSSTPIPPPVHTLPAVLPAATRANLVNCLRCNCPSPSQPNTILWKCGHCGHFNSI